MAGILRSARTKIVNALVVAMQEIDGTGPHLVRIEPTNIVPYLQWWDDVNDTPFMCIVAGGERRVYEPGNVKWGYLTVSIKLYVNHAEADIRNQLLEDLLASIEYVIDTHQQIDLQDGRFTPRIDVATILTDEGLFAPTGVADITLEVQYQVT